MASESIFQHTSFFTLNKPQKNTVKNYVNGIPTSDLSQFEINKIFQSQSEMSVTTDYWDNRINKLDQFVPCRAAFQSISDNEKEILEQELVFAFYIFCARYQLDQAEGRGYDQDDENRPKQLEKCAKLINTLRIASKSNDHVKVTPAILSTLPEIQDDGIKSGVNKMCSFNERRLYWVWAGRGGLLGTVIGLLPDDFFYKLQALNVLDVPVPFTDFLSWGLYYFRFDIRLWGVLRHVIGMSNEEKNIPWKDRLAAQLDLCKFDLINDVFWASGNLVCSFWLKGSPIADYYAGVLTAVLLLMDVSITLWAYHDEYVQYCKDMRQYTDDINGLTGIEQAHQSRMARQCKLDWDYNLYAMYLDVMYAIGLLLAFCLLYCFFLPPAIVPVATALVFNVSGTALCFTLNAFSAAIKQVLDICHSIEELKFTIKDYSKIQDKSSFDAHFFASEMNYHQNLTEYKQACLLRSVLIDLLVPVVVFVALVFMPLPIGLAVLAVGLMIAVASYYYVDHYYPHEVSSLPKYNPENKLPQSLTSPGTQGFFGYATECLSKNRDADAIFCCT